MIRVLVADDQALVRAGFGMILGAHKDIEVVGEAADGLEAVEMVEKVQPDVVLMDVRMPGVDGIEATRRLVGRGNNCVRVIILTTFDLDEYVYEGMRAGASGFLLKSAPPGRLADAVREVAIGETLLAPSITRRLIEQFVRRPPPGGDVPLDLGNLTERELQVLRHIATGKSNAEISRALFLSEATVKSHVTHLLAKLGLRDRVQAVILAYESGLVQPGSQPLLDE
ncbi:MAG: response regulator [Acidimicrobiales bacterium]